MTSASTNPQASSPSEGAAGTLRVFLFLSAAAVYAGVIVELWFMDHTEELLQWVPFAACVAALAVVAAVLVRPSAPTLWLVRLTLPLVLAVSALGMYEHVHANYEFEREIRPRALTLEVFGHALHGVAPILAPGSLGLAGALAAAATVKHAALGKRES